MITVVDREEVVAEAFSYLGTRYEKNGRVKGAGVDCATILFCVWRDCGIIPPGEEGIFSDPSIVPTGQDWFCHANEEKYMLRILRHADKVLQGISYPNMQAKPGNIALTKAVGSRRWNHGGIVTCWPMVIHAVDPVVEEANASTHWLWDHQEVCIFDPWERASVRG